MNGAKSNKKVLPLFAQIKAIYNYREMILMIVKRDLRSRYRRSVLGFLWTFLNPLLQLGVYTMVFSIILRSDIEKYYLFLFIALIPWIFMSTSLTAGSTCVVSQSNLVTKIYFPRQVLPISHVATCFVNMLLCFVVVLAVCACSIGLNIIALPFLIPVMLIEFILALGITMIASALTVYFRDLEHIIGILTMAWQFLTPIMYPASIVPERLMWVFNLNPMTHVIQAYRAILYHKTIPDMSTILPATAYGILFLIIGWVVFDHCQKHFAEEL